VKTPFELPANDRLTEDPALVTCGPVSPERLNAVVDDARRWHQVRGGINEKPRRRGNPLRMDTLGDCIQVMESYRGVLTRIEVALNTIDVLPSGRVIQAVHGLLESIRDGYPVKISALKDLAQHVADADQHTCTQPVVHEEAAPRRGSGWGA